MHIGRGLRSVLFSVFVVETCNWVSAAPNVAAEQASADGVWRTAAKVPAAQLRATPWVRPNVFQGANLNRDALENTLAAAPMEFTQQARTAPLEITLPKPDGTFARFSIFESPVMAPALAAKYPQIKTYAGVGIDDPYASVRLDWTPAGFHAQVLTPNGSYYVDPYTKGDTGFYASYFRKDAAARDEPFSCLTEPDVIEPNAGARGAQILDSGDTLRIYRTAVAATGEYTTFHSAGAPTVAEGLAAIVVAMNRVNGIYEREVSVRMELVADNDLVVYTNGSTDPYTNNSGGTMLGQNQSNLDAVIGSADYDVGHVFSTGGGGIANLRVPCTSSKARGVTGLGSPIGDAFYVDYVAHEMGHQYGGNHTFNGVGFSCSGGNRNGSTAYEPGSASTIMGYAGICGPNDDLQLHSDPYFHSESYDEMIDFVSNGAGSICPVTVATGNTAPTVEAGPDFTIPMDTPFVLTAVGSDPDGHPITYNWEERDLGPAQQAAGMVDNGASPLFRSFTGFPLPYRTFPRLLDIVNNTTTIGEVLPTTTRTMTFRVTVRDNRPSGGGVSFDEMQLNVVESIGPFRVTSPNTNVTWAGTQTVTWDVAGTDGGSVSTDLVNIRLSTNGGSTFDTVLAANTPNDGSEEVTLPAIQSSAARVKVEAVDNVYFDMSDTNFNVDLFSTPAAPPSPHFIVKNRYISFDPNNGSSTVAFQVSLAEGPGDLGVLGWVGEPYDGGCFNDDGTSTGLPCANDFLARVVSAPVFRVWPEEVVHVADCEIVPQATYELRTSDDGVSFVAPVEFATISKPIDRHHGDIVGVFIGVFLAPNGVVNVTDLQALLFCLQELPNAPHRTWCDLHGLGIGSPPNYIANVSDVQQILKGAEGLTFLASNPDNRNPSDCP